MTPVIKSFENGILAWQSSVKGVIYRVTVNGVLFCESGDAFLDTANKVFGKGAIRVDVTAVDGVVRGGTLSVVVDSKRKKLSFPPVKIEKIKDEVMYWRVTGNVRAYRVVDIDMTVAAVIPTRGAGFLSYDMSYKTIVYGVYPLSDTELIPDAEIAPCEIKYLEGEGSEKEPYKIKTPFDLRTLDYYETRYAERAKSDAGSARNHYIITADIDYAKVASLETDSNIYTLAKPFFGVLDGCGHTLAGIRVVYDGGYWAFFDFLAPGSTVKNIVFDRAEITNALQSVYHPLDASIATVADINNGTISDIKVVGAKYSASGGEISGICSHNAGIVQNCTVSGEFRQDDAGIPEQACYESGGIVTENLDGGTVLCNTVTTLAIRGTTVERDYAAANDPENAYNNIRTAGGIVAVNRAGGRVERNAFVMLEMSNIFAGGNEYGGITAYNVGTVIVGDESNIGSFTVDGFPIREKIGSNENGRTGKCVGNNGGTCE